MSRCLKTASDGADATWRGRSFQKPEKKWQTETCREMFIFRSSAGVTSSGGREKGGGERGEGVQSARWVVVVVIRPI